MGTKVIYAIRDSNLAFLSKEDLEDFIKIANNSEEYDNVFDEDIMIFDIWEKRNDR